MRVENVKETLGDFTIGADPELFLIDYKTKRFVIPPETLVTGTKDKKQELCVLEEGTAEFHLDGFALEINTPPVLFKTAKFPRVINDCIVALKNKVEKHNKEFGTTFSLRAVPYAKFDRSVTSDPKILEIGCSPALYSKLNGSIYSVQNYVSDPYRRFAGGHIHIGWGDEKDPTDEFHIYECMLITRFLGRSVYFSDLSNAERIRRSSLYGISSSFRPTKYGVEWRGPSNFWLSSPYNIRLMHHSLCINLERLLRNGAASRPLIYSLSKKSYSLKDFK